MTSLPNPWFDRGNKFQFQARAWSSSRCAHARAPQGVAGPQGIAATDVPVMFGCDGLGAIAPLEYCGTNVVHYQHSLAKVLAAPGFVAVSWILDRNAP